MSCNAHLRWELDQENMEQVKNLLGELNRFADVTCQNHTSLSGMNSGDECNSALEMPSDLA